MKIPNDFQQTQSLVLGLPETGLTDAQAAKLNDLVNKYANGEPPVSIQFIEAPR